MPPCDYDTRHYTKTSRSNQHSAFSTSFPIYLWNEVEEEVPIEEDTTLQNDPETKGDGEEAVVEEEKESEPVAAKTKKVVVGLWEHLNSQQPLWMRYVLTF